LRRIEIGTELSIDYGWDLNLLEGSKPLECFCGAKSCRRQWREIEQNIK
jgi:SET domain-containing protein